MTQVPTGSHGPLLTRTAQASAAQILNIHNVPLTLVPAQGAGKTILPVAFAQKLHFGTTPYANGSNPAVGLGTSNSDNNIVWTLTSSDWSGSADSVGVAFPVTSDNTFLASGFENTALICSAGATPFVNGDSTLTFYILYAVLTL